MVIKRDELFKFLEELTGDKCYVGLHYIFDDSDFKNEFSHLSKEEKAINIMKTGLINERMASMKSTCKIFGNLSTTYESNKNEVIGTNRFSFTSLNGENVVVVVAVPIVFEDTKGRKLFGGWMNPGMGFNDDDSPLECITDKLFEQNIPKETILGYYTFDDGDKEIEFISNDKHYLLLSDEEKDKFIQEYFDKNDCSIDINNPNIDVKKEIYNKLEKEEEEARIIIWRGHTMRRVNRSGFDLRENILAQITEYMSPEYQEKVNVRNASREKVRDIIPYTLEELENTSIENIEIERIVPNLDFIISDKYGIKESLIKSNIKEERAKTLMNTVGFQNEGKDEDTIVEEFEKFIIDAGNTLDNIYPYWYQRNYKYFNKLFVDKISRLKEERLKEIEEKEAPLKEREKTLITLEQESKDIAKTEQLVEINENVQSNENSNG